MTDYWTDAYFNGWLGAVILWMNFQLWAILAIIFIFKP
jgi:hypothetical protein